MPMEESRRDPWSWAVTAVCCLYVVWATHFFASNIPAFGSLAAGLGEGMVPRTTSMVIAASRSLFSYLAAAVLIGGLIAKELSRLGRGAKIAVTAIVYMVVSWLLQLSIEAVFLPILDIAKKIQG